MTTSVRWMIVPLLALVPSLPPSRPAATDEPQDATIDMAKRAAESHARLEPLAFLDGVFRQVMQQDRIYEQRWFGLDGDAIFGTLRLRNEIGVNTTLDLMSITVEGGVPVLHRRTFLHDLTDLDDGSGTNLALASVETDRARFQNDDGGREPASIELALEGELLEVRYAYHNPKRPRFEYALRRVAD